MGKHSGNGEIPSTARQTEENQTECSNGVTQVSGEVIHKTHHGCHINHNKFDYLLWGSLAAILFLYLQSPWLSEQKMLPTWYRTLISSTFELINTVWWSLAIGVLMVSVLSKIPREFIISILGTREGIRGIMRAAAAGVLLDLCSHGILMVGAKLYERGASIGQVMAFLIASPWNSFSLTLVLIALIGLPWTFVFIVLSMVIALLTGYIFDQLVHYGKLPANEVPIDLPENFSFWPAVLIGVKETRYDFKFFKSMLWDGLQESRMVIRWMLFGILLAGLVRAFVPADIFGTFFGPTLAGLGLTILAATVIEVCSEGSTPIAADLLTRANAPGNSFAFLMTGVATDYTEIMVLKDVTKTWRIPLALPLITVPQVLMVAWVINHFTA
jgi:uncharacterized membrane protein YraQ (UPF0718 family)